MSTSKKINKTPHVFITLLKKGFRNKYFTILVFAGIYMMFFDRFSIYRVWKLKHSISELEHQSKWLSQQIKQTKVDIQYFEQNKEKFAREMHFMKRPDEDIFLVVPEN